jgi:nucleotidyltransferase substrate binding protein (TIGR01987 family)
MKLVNDIDIEPLLKAAASFFEALGDVKSDLTRDGAIQRFEYTFELCWKTMKRILRSKGSQVNHPKDVFREAAQERMIKDPSPWFEFLECRNKTTHIYNQKVAQEVFSHMKGFSEHAKEFLEHLESLVT